MIKNLKRRNSISVSELDEEIQYHKTFFQFKVCVVIIKRNQINLMNNNLKIAIIRVKRRKVLNF